MENENNNNGLLTTNDFEQMNFAELAIYIEQLNKLEKAIIENVDEGDNNE